MERRVEYKSILTLCLTVLAVFFIIWTFTGKWFWLSQSYNSYILQAQAWKDGRLSLLENYSHLEIATYEGKYFVSFPPFPSYIMFPFVLMGFNNCDGFIALISALAGVSYAFLICRHFDIKTERAMLLSLLLTIGSNWLFTAQASWVWFIAQNLAFTLSLMAIYYALKKKCGLCLALWACAVGCRPFQVLYLPIILYLIYDSEISIIDNIKLQWKSAIPMLIIAVSYMALNYARFENPLEFGHNYLPEFIEAENGQFSFAYISENIKTLFRLPEISFTDKWVYQEFNGTNIFIISPIFLSFIIYTAYAFIKSKENRLILLLTLSVILLQLICITAHKTMGGWQFGNRYTNDILPLVFLSICYSLPDNKFDKFDFILLVFGTTVNVIGSVLFYM